MHLTYNEIEEAFRRDGIPTNITPAPSGSPFVVFAEHNGDDALSFDRDDVLGIGGGCTTICHFGGLVGPWHSVRKLSEDVKWAFRSIDKLIETKKAQLAAI